MENSIVLASLDNCTGCAACVDICAKSCITLEYNNSIHFYPVINADKCVSCGICLKTCPSLNRTERVAKEQKYYKAWHNDENERMTSTSGGAGAAIVDSALAKGWYVCGAAMDEALVLKHIVTDDAEMARLFKGSKYLQSDMVGVYKVIRSLVKGGKKVLFIGAPCQVEGLNRYLQDLKNNVLTCGIICHGVNSPKVWEDYKVWLENKQKSKLSEYQFRSKSHGWQRKKGGPNLRVAYTMENGKIVNQPAWMNLFHWWFGHHFILRPACLDCYYRKEYRNSDITIGDFWGVEKVSKDDVDTYKGVSVVITSTERGDSFVKECDCMCCEEVDAEHSKKVLRGFVENKTVEQCLKQIEREKSFESEYLRLGIDKMASKYPAQTHVSRTIHLIKSKLGLS